MMIRILPVAAALAFATGAALAANETYRSKNSGDWGNYAPPYTWQVFRSNQWVNVASAADIPNAGDTVTINNTGSGEPHWITVSNAQSVTSLTIASSGRLDIGGTDATDAVLTFSTPGTPSLSITPFDGLVLLDGSASLRFEASAMISGAGTLKGQDSDASIVLATSASTNVSLTSNVLIYGALVIKDTGSGDGYFINGNIVRAHLPGEAITLDASLDGIDDIGGRPCNTTSRWEVGVAGAVLRFNCAATNLSGDFKVGSGTLDVNKPVSTGGGLAFGSGGAITPQGYAGACFSFGGHCGGCTIQSPVCYPRRCH